MAVRREAVAGYVLADARTIERSSEGVRVLGRSEGEIDWKRSGCRESVSITISSYLPLKYRM
jgi:hypothetical protein